jgi:hypothetical protein
MMVAFQDEEEAHFLCGCLNSTPAQLIVVGSVVLHPDTHVLRRVRVPRFAPKDRLHLQIAILSRRCHEAVSRDDATALNNLEAELDAACGEIWELNESEIRCMRDCLAELAGRRRRRSDRAKIGDA